MDKNQGAEGDGRSETRNRSASAVRAEGAASDQQLSAEQQAATFRYVDRPDCVETFADCITGLTFDGQTLRLEFGISRLDEMKQNMPISGRRYPVCRLVLPPAAAIDLINRMQQIAVALTQAGLIARPSKDSRELTRT